MSSPNQSLYSLNFVELNQVENEDKSLSRDGYYDYLQPYKFNEKIQKPFNRRLWLRGSIYIDSKDDSNNKEFKITLIEGLKEVKKLRNNAVVTTVREIIDTTNNQVLLTEKRNIFYTNDRYKPANPQVDTTFDDFESDFESKMKPFTSDDITTFSKLSSNPHHIHLNAKYNHEVEGFPEKLVVQGPYLLLESIKFLTNKLNVKHLSSINYKIKTVVFENDELTIKLDTKSKQLVLGSSEKGVCLSLEYVI